MSDRIQKALQLLDEEIADLERRIAKLEGEQPEPQTKAPPTRLEQIQKLLGAEK